jgi:hypothetical protein
MANTLPPRPVYPPYKGSVKFGVIPPSHKMDPRAWQPGPPTFPPDPPMVDWIGMFTNWGILGNDTIGDCVIACMGHVIDAWTGYASVRVTIAQADAIAAYSALTGYNPQTGQPDPGLVVANAMTYWQTTGLAGHKIDKSCATNMIGVPAFYQPMIMDLVQYYGAAIMVFALPTAAITAFHAGDPWLPNMGPGIDLHCVPVLAYDQTWAEVVTWGRSQRVSWDFVRQYTTEIWGVMSIDWMKASGSSPTNQSRAYLDQSLVSVVTGVIIA